MKLGLMRSDLAVLSFAVAGFLLTLLDCGIWLDRCMGAILMVGGVYFGLMGIGVLPRFRRRPGAIPYSVVGGFLIVQGIALGVFHARF